MSEKQKLNLNRPVSAHGAEVDCLELREPHGGDIASVGFPLRYKIESDETVTIDFKAREMSAMISRLADVPLSTVQRLPASDWQAAAWMVAGFLTPSESQMTGTPGATKTTGQASSASE
jgi:hypothetical protein